MPKPDSATYPLYLLPCLWGLDAPVAVLSWGLLTARAQGTEVMPASIWALILLFLWLVMMQQRVLAAAGGQNIAFADFYCRYKRRILLLCWIVAAVVFWLMLCCVPMECLWYTVIPIFLLLLGRIPLLKRWVLYSSACSAAALAVACAIPAYCYDLLLSPYHLVSDSLLGGLTLVFFVFLYSRSLPLSRFLPQILQWVLTLGMFVYFSQHLAHEEEHMQRFYLSLCAFSFVLFVWYRLRSGISEEAWYALSWPFMALPPLIFLCF